jgi:CubicO group peptidase (beta-lactamase class C family)
MRKILATLLLTLFGSYTFAQDFSKLDQFIDSLELHHKFMGNILLKKDGKTLFQKSVGFGNISKNQKLEKDSKFKVASISKMLTAVIYFKTLESGKLSGDQKLSDFFPEIPKSDSITIDNLLNHRSGLYNYTDQSFLDYKTEFQTSEFMVSKIAEGGSVFSPGTDGWYSNSNFYILSLILQQVNGIPLPQQISEWITAPLGMKNTLLPSPNQHPEVISYTYYNDWEIIDPTDPSVLLGAGAVVSTAEDLAKFIEGLFTGQLIKQESLSSMISIKDDFGRGISSFPFEGHQAYGHTGSIDGFQTLLSYFPEEGLSLSFLSNGMNYNYGDITEAVISTYFGKELEIPDLRRIKLSVDELQKYVGAYRSDDTPLLLSFKIEDGLLIAFPSGYEPAALSPKGNHTFEFIPVNAEMIFSPEDGKMTLNQGGESYFFKKR